uniref:Uncharacterized protein n=1 Tax=Micrurus spixii TaxID=129469 RepID=A0A2D4MEC4_9SAUR
MRTCTRTCLKLEEQLPDARNQKLFPDARMHTGLTVSNAHAHVKTSWPVLEWKHLKKHIAAAERGFSVLQGGFLEKKNQQMGCLRMRSAHTIPSFRARIKKTICCCQILLIKPGNKNKTS